MNWTLFSMKSTSVSAILQKSKLKLSKGILASSLLLVPIQLLHAEEEAAVAPGYDWYTGSDVAFSSVDLDFYDLDEKSRPVALTLRGGVQFHPNVALELRYSFGIQKENLYAPVRAEGNDKDQLVADIELNSMSSVFAKGILPTQLPMRPYVLLGFSQVETTLKGIIDDTESSTKIAIKEVIKESGVSMGAGVDLLLEARYSINVEYLSAVSVSGTSVSFFNFGLNYHW